MPAPSEILRRGLAAGGRTQASIPASFKGQLQNLGPPTIIVKIDEKILSRLGTYAALLDHAPKEASEVLDTFLQTLGKIYVGLIRQKIDIDRTFTGRLAETIDYRIESSPEGPLATLIVGSFPESGALGSMVETDYIRHPVSYVYPLLYGTAPYPVGRQPPFLRIAYWAVNKLNIDLSSKEGGKRLRAVYGKIMRDGVDQHNFLADVAPDTPEAQALIKRAEDWLLLGLEALVKPPEGEWEEADQEPQQLVVKRRRAYEKLNEQFESEHARLLEVPKAVRRAAAIAAIAIRRRAARRREKLGPFAPRVVGTRREREAMRTVRVARRFDERRRRR